MAQPCKVFSYTNVGTEKGVLANIASAAQAGGWTVDKNAVDADGELYLHSAGGGNRRLFFSLRLLQAHDNAERFLLAVHGNTGFDASAAWDAQPGRFTERLAHGYCSRTTGNPSGSEPRGNTASRPRAGGSCRRSPNRSCWSARHSS